MARGPAAAHVVSLPGGWTGVVATGSCGVGEPYDDAAVVTLCRPTPVLMRPSLGVLASENRVTFVVQERAFKAHSRWLLAQAGVGTLRTALPPASSADILTTTRARSTGQVEALLSGQQPPSAAAHTTPGVALAADVLRGCQLPEAARLISGDIPSTARFVQPSRRSVRRFDRTITTEAEERREVESWLR